jgi:hypothetical protein
MSETPLQNDRLIRLYTLALFLYPATFRQRYAGCMRQTFRDALGDRSLPRRSLLPLVLRDLITSLAKEHLAMLRDTFARPALIYNAAVLAGLATVLAYALYAIPQQVLRRVADDPQVEMADNLAWQLEQGVAPASAIPSGSVEIARSLSPFLIAFDDQGHLLASQATLSGHPPALPMGILDFVRQHGEDRFTWRPAQGVRIAAVVQRVNGAHPGFVLAGRSLREEAARQNVVQEMAAVAWAAMLALIVLGTAAFSWYTRPKTVEKTSVNA